MKTEKNLFNRVASFENLVLAANRAAVGKGMQVNVLQFFQHLEDNLFLLQGELLSKEYRPGGYRSFYIKDPKPRHISAASFRDRVVHHALCAVIEPIFDASLIDDTYANRKAKGTHAAIRRAQSFIRRNDYMLKCDIKKYFASIDHLILKQMIRQRIADPDVLWLCDSIIDGSNEQEFVKDYFPGDDLLTPLERRKGLPLGNLTSQFFANIYLNSLDHYVKEMLRAKHYVRYVDDFIIAANSKPFLHFCRESCEVFLQRFRLKLHPKKCHILASRRGVPFLGQVVHPTHRLLKKENVRRFTQRLRKKYHLFETGELTREELDAAVAGWTGHAQQADTWKLRQELQNKFSEMDITLTY